jgi:hypothetical protein
MTPVTRVGKPSWITACAKALEAPAPVPETSGFTGGRRPVEGGWLVRRHSSLLTGYSGPRTRWVRGPLLGCCVTTCQEGHPKKS